MNTLFSLLKTHIFGLCLGFFLALALSTPSQASDRAEAFNQPEKVMGLYYLNPDPSLLPDLCYGLSQGDELSLRERVLPTAAFFAPIFQAHPEQAQALAEDVAAFSNTVRSILALAVSYADMPGREKLIPIFLPEEDKDFTQELVESPPLNVLDLPMTHASELTMLLSNFWATGNSAPIEHLVSGLAFADRTDIPYSIIARNVQYLLMAQAVQQPRILEILRLQLELLQTQNPPLAEELRKVIARAETELSNIAQAEVAFAAREAEVVDGENFLDDDFSVQEPEGMAPAAEEWSLLND